MNTELKYASKNKSTEKCDTNLLSILSFTMEKVKELADANSILGEKIEINGVTIIPVSKISVGFAGGGADIADVAKKKRQRPAGSGGGVTVTPMTFLVINGDEVTLMDVNKPDKNSAVVEIINTIFDQIKSSKKETE